MKKIRVLIYEQCTEPLLRYDLWKWGINLDGTYESDKHKNKVFTVVSGTWYRLSYNDKSSFSPQELNKFQEARKI